MLEQLKQQFMLSQVTIGTLEMGFNYLINRSPHCLPTLKKLKDSTLHIKLLQPEFECIINFSETQTDWLSHYEGNPSCCLSLQSSVLPKLADKTKLTELINNKTLLLEGDIQVLQHFVQLLDELEKNPAELLSPFVGDVIAQGSTDVAGFLFNKAKQQIAKNSEHIVDNLINECSVLVHQLEIANFCDEVTALEKQANQLEMKVRNSG
ncbi:MULTISPECIES: ubiquinone biosynthesis accessory factor UbiJ [Pasteurellaceae]|uniref:SCP2 sterol-binding domain-containing protein n=1 Tax=Pasteurella atlantica TaxID=2827233 RepID=A0AAW8CQQ4_9PAST|nr:SCP2 sterol-binding domain-containing protein [Pasteurella atlantica]MBR0573107.1 SCP2 sterol-binding domain-containing protein [Pasteurella atlantica]MDP8039036.1 SCP2 sterol-binding domain-containing protein [Pasteurella atlantica]MDP8041126.1 SCP2 sterol-binding domain-containing protein [Pasteurella atlantica]MDP8043261.1 SCP2 sterol-binding domain-containing protein [Pasteurella atlantica]MDP8045347.1 SCP2 sterol-binding domain-containing protein [Pasteurella atlantica]